MRDFLFCLGGFIGGCIFTVVCLWEAAKREAQTRGNADREDSEYPS